MDPEQTFLRVHARLSEMLSPRIRTALEYVFLVAAIALFGLLVIMHTNFVQQPGCSSEFTRNEIAKANLVQIKITSNDPWLQSAAKTIMTEASEQGISSENLKATDVSGEGLTVLTTKSWINWFGSGARKGKLVFKSWKSGREFLEARMECIPENSHSIPSTGEKSSRIAIEALGIVFGSVWESLETSFVYLFNKWQEYFDFFGKNIKDNLGSVNKQQWEEIEHGDTWWNFLRVILKWMHVFWSEGIESFTIQLLEKKSRTFEPTYMYTVEKGYLLLPEAAKSEHSIQTVNISISPWNSCFGNRWQQLLINLFVGYDTILVNSLLNTPGQGYLYNFQTREFYDLSHAHEPAEGHSQFEDYIVTKSGVLIMSLFVFFTTTMPVSFTLRETQSRMLKFTVQLQHHAQHQLPTFQLIFVHVIESLVFVPIMIGILFFLFEFYDDQMLAFMVLTLVWLCELFTMISVRTSISMQFFPRFFVLYFLVFHIYYFSYAYGFSYLAFWTTAAFMLHLILYFWNRFEVPALQRFLQNQSQLQQQTGVHITSSTILTSTLHITRVNVSNPTASSPELGLPTELDPGQPDLLGAVDANGSYEPAVSDNPEMIDAPSESDSQQNEDTQNSGSLNSFSSLLLWILGGASSDNLVSFFSMFREMRQGQVYPEPGQQDNHLSGGQSSWWRRR